MDAKQLEAVLGEVGKVFRLCRFYPATHPSVQQAMADLSAVLPAFAELGEVELRIAPSGFALDNVLVTAKNAQMQEFAGLLYAQGHRAMRITPGVTAEEFAALVRAASGATVRSGAALGVVQQKPQLPHIQLEQTATRKSAPGRPARISSPGMQVPDNGLAPSARGTGVFRPNALPAEIEATRLTSLLEFATADGARGPLGRLAEVAAQLAEQRDFGALATAEAARRALAAAVSDATVAGMVGLVDARAPADQRQAAAEALGALGERATPALFEAYLGATDDAVREVYGRAIAAAPSAGAYLVSRLAADHPAAARASAALLGALGEAAAVGALAPLTRHTDAGLRRAAVGALARLGGTDASRAVVTALRDADPGVRFEAAAGLARLGDRAFAPILLARLKDELDDSVVIALVDALARVGDPRAVPQLVELAKGVSGVFRRSPVAVRASAIRALVALGTPEALAAVAPFKADRHPDLKNAASEPPPAAGS